MLVKAKHPQCCKQRAVLYGLVILLYLVEMFTCIKLNVRANIGKAGRISWLQENKHLGFLQAESGTVLWFVLKNDTSKMVAVKYFIWHK